MKDKTASRKILRGHAIGGSMTPTIPDGKEVTIHLTETPSKIRRGDIIWYAYQGRNYVHRVGTVRPHEYVMVADGDVEPHIILREAVLGQVQVPWWNRGRFGWGMHHVARSWGLAKRIPSLFDPMVRIPDMETCDTLVAEQYSDAEEVALYRGDVPLGLTEIERQVVEEFMKPPEKILNVGCGPGREAMALARMGFEVVGIDRSSAMIQSAIQVDRLKASFDFAQDFIGHGPRVRRGAIRLQFECVEAGQFQAPAVLFDVIYFSAGSPSYGLMAGRKRRIALLSHFRSLLKPNGLIIFSVIYDESVSRWSLSNVARIVRSILGWVQGEGYHGERGDCCSPYGGHGQGASSAEASPEPGRRVATAAKRGFHHVFESPLDVLEEVKAGGFEPVREIGKDHTWVCRLNGPSESSTSHEVALTILYEQETLRILRRASEEGLQVVLLKGLALLATGWVDPLTRAVHDVDLLARSSDLEILGKILGELGYREMDFGDARVKSYQNDKSLLVEVHTHLIPQAQCLSAYRVDMEDAWASAKSLEWDGTTARVLSREWMLLHAILHLGLRHGLRGKKWFADIFRLASGLRSDFSVQPPQPTLLWRRRRGGSSEPPLDVEAFDRLVRRVGAVRLTQSAIWAAYKCFGEGRSSPWGRPPGWARRMVGANLLASVAQEFVETAWPWILADRWKNRWAMCVPERRREGGGESGAVNTGSRFVRFGRFLGQGFLGVLVLVVGSVIPEGAVTEARTK